MGQVLVVYAIVTTSLLIIWTVYSIWKFVRKVEDHSKSIESIMGDIRYQNEWNRDTVQALDRRITSDIEEINRLIESRLNELEHTVEIEHNISCCKTTSSNKEVLKG